MPASNSPLGSEKLQDRAPMVGCSFGGQPTELLGTMERAWGGPVDRRQWQVALTTQRNCCRYGG
jgi:hypothetical protein